MTVTRTILCDQTVACRLSYSLEGVSKENDNKALAHKHRNPAAGP